MMKVGDLVKWIGFPGADLEGVRITGPSCVGIVIRTRPTPSLSPLANVDVAWSDGTIGRKLYPQTLEVVNEEE